MANIGRRLTPQPIKVRADIDVTCFGYKGIDAIKEALRAGETLSTEEMQIKVSFLDILCLITKWAECKMGK